MIRVFLLLLCVSFETLANPLTLVLTPQEQAWIDHNPLIAFTGDPNWLPYEAFEEDGEYIGMVADHLKLIEQQTKLKFMPVPVDNWSESLRIASEGGVDVISGDAADAILNERFNPVKTYSQNPIIIVMDHRHRFINDLAEIRDRRIAIIKDYGYTADIFRQYPGFEFIKVENIQEGLEGLSQRRFDAMLATMALASYHIAEQGLYNLRIVGKTPIMMNLTLFVSKQQPELASIINKALHAIPQEQKQDIYRKWIRSHYVEKTDYTIALVIAASLFSILLLVWLWNRELKKEIRLRKETEINLRESEARLHRLFEVTDAVSVQGYDHKRRVIYWNRASENLYGYSVDEALGRKMEDLIVPDEMRDSVVAGIDAWLDDGTSIPSIELLLKRADGSPIEVFSSQVMFHNAHNEPEMYRIDIDLTELKAAQREIKLLSEAVEQSPVSVIITDAGANIEYVNPSFEAVSGYSSEDVVGKNTSVFKSGLNDDETYRQLWNSISQGRTWQGQLRNRTKDGRLIWEQLHVAPVSDVDGNIQHFLALKQDVTLQKEQEDKIMQQAHFDTLTGLPNRFLGLDRLTQLIKEAERSGTKVAVLFTDLDDFKKVNDTMGHDTGDTLLIEAAERLRKSLREGDTVSRLGGDEFLVMLGGIQEPKSIQPVVENMLNRFRQPFRIDGRDFLLTLSIGISVFPEDGDNASELLRNSDSAMYHSKDRGRNTYSFFTQEMNQDIARRLQLEQHMHGAMERDEFHLVFQPQIEAASGRIHGFEVLLRWTNQALGEVPPEEFIPIAEQNGLIVSLTRFVLEQALPLAAAWDQTIPGLHIAINLSPRQFRDPGMVRLVQQQLSASGLPPEQLELEITEGVLMSGHEYIDEALERLYNLGINIVLDDFGTGYSSLSFLRSYPFDVVKIDRSFIQDLVADPSDRELVNASIAMAHGLGLRVVAEGVEEVEQLNHLKRISCDTVQGFYFSHPVPADKVPELLQD
jgi:diguanylate cyclase (GGDEF)-like protein/PAS domain S-box-containing protein